MDIREFNFSVKRYRSTTTDSKDRSLKEICLQAARKHFTALGIKAILDLPVALIKDVLPHLTVCQLDQLQPALNQREISTYSGWVGIIRDIWGPNHVIDVHTEEEAKHEVMKCLFPLVFYGFRNNYTTRNSTNLNTPSFLWAAAKCIHHFLISTNLPKPLQSLTAENWPLLNLFEERIRSVTLSHSLDLSQRKTQLGLYVFHRLFDHGKARKLTIHMQCPMILAWLLHGRGSQYVDPKLKDLLDKGKAACTLQADDQDDQATPCKRSKLDFKEEEESGKEDINVDPQCLCRAFTPFEGPSAGACPWGQIHCLEIRECGPGSFRLLSSVLPTFFCLHSLTLHSIMTLRDPEVMDLAGALKQLSDSSRSSLADLKISILPNIMSMEFLLDSCPSVTSLQVEIQELMWGVRPLPPYSRAAEPDFLPVQLALEKLTVKVTELQTDVLIVTSVLRRSPRLTSFHVAGMRLHTSSSQSHLLTTLSESNPCLRSLFLEDTKLSDCFPDILKLLRHSRLEELRFHDCRLLEKCLDKEENLQLLVAAVKTVPSLHTLGLAQNRIARSVCVLADLFTGSSTSSVKCLDIRSNFIQPAELLEFATRIKTHPPKHRLTLDLRRNPGDRDPDTWCAALDMLRPFTVLLVEGWKSTDTMVDHLSNM
ncbi:uncharacterized protein lrrc41 [Parambassis ranga]|uniref:Leucine-rich repeat-containing protein 41 n=1 Tax=Parambassis ranga TaxID=210632 RepID=A0A6P7IBB6_9TELE|nr:leucine-rich repeat-containing protein 41 [Parambassis ranga]